MTPYEAAAKLTDMYGSMPWWHSVGVGIGDTGQPTLYLYTVRAPPSPIADIDGYHVSVQVVGKVRPL